MAPACLRPPGRHLIRQRVSTVVLVHLTMAHLHAAQLAGTAGHPVCVCGVRDLGIDTRIVRPAYRHARHAVFRNT